MKGKKLSAFAVFQKSQSQPSNHEEHNESVVKNKKKRKMTESVREDPVMKRKKENQQNQKDTAVRNNLDKLPATLGKKSQSFPNIKKQNSPVETKLVSQNSCQLTGSIKKKRRSINSNIPPPETKTNNKMVQEEDAETKTETETKVVIPPDVKPLHDSREDAQKCFEWLIHPVKPEKFFKELWEKKPMLLKRHHPTYYKGIFSCKELDTILREKNLYYGKNIDITSYINNVRETHNPAGRAFPAVVWDFYRCGCSVRILNPQTFSKSVWKLNSILQEYFGSCVGANVYLTPPGSQGFAPHYDDIEAFVLQLEGRKRWKLYNPRSPSETLPRYSSENFTADEVGEPILNIELEPGDLLYFPRGIIHQASTPDDIHSLHVTVSSCQRNTWGDLLERLIPRTVQIAFEEDLEFRESLPLNYQQFVGLAHSDIEHPSRQAFFDKLKHLMKKLLDYAPVDSAADQMSKDYIYDCLPPVLSKDEKAVSVQGSSERWENGEVVNVREIVSDTSIRLLRANIIRLVMEENAVRIYHSVDNSREYHGENPQYLEITPEWAPSIELLIHTYPAYLPVEELLLEKLTDKIDLTKTLYEKGLLTTEEPLPLYEFD